MQSDRSDSTVPKVRLTKKGRWVIARIRELDPNALAAHSPPERFRLAYERALTEWEAAVSAFIVERG